MKSYSLLSYLSLLLSILAILPFVGIMAAIVPFVPILTNLLIFSSMIFSLVLSILSIRKEDEKNALAILAILINISYGLFYLFVAMMARMA
ncbi:hypothetical protein [Pontibacillus halophilus]|uniref:hypothetical protein n=1 Tax=Pontibacillus halophilus TaxID=516704 RepID=UPI00047984F2|nr:hypothetical protein [Pontibacillus halophilus]